MTRRSGRQRLAIAAIIVSCVAACRRDATRDQTTVEGIASTSTRERNDQVARDVPLDDTTDFFEAHRGFIARPVGDIRTSDGRVLVDFSAFNFEQGPAPATVNPSLWRHARLNAEIGLYQVTEGIWQLRGFDVANMTIIAGTTGWIVVDPLMSRESAAAAIAFARQHLDPRPVSAVIFTHSHIDHFGGVLGVLTAEEARDRHVPIVAPAGFMDEATSENGMVGTVMGRRSAYQFGKDLPRSATGFVDAGLGKGLAYGNFGILPPTITIDGASQNETIDGVAFVFHNVPGAEAPAELTFSIPARRAYDGAELFVQTMHNLLPIRGAKVRDGLKWSRYLDDAMAQTADAEVAFSQHTWPVWGATRIRAKLAAQRDTYKYIHDQTVRLMNEGRTPQEIAERVTLPPTLQRALGSRGYYGDVRHNVRAVYQFYLGAYDGNPAHLDPLPPTELAKRRVALAGGAARVIAEARKAMAAGDYRWAVELLNDVVFGAPSSQDTKELLAQAYEQLGYVAESATWRNAYLTGARELRFGPPKVGVDRSAFVEMLSRTPTERFLESMAASLDGPAAIDKSYTINLVLSDTHESYVLWIENAVLHHRAGPPAPNADATITLTKSMLVRMIAGTADVKSTLLSDELRVSGSRVNLVRFFLLIEKFPGTFPIVTP